MALVTSLRLRLGLLLRRRVRGWRRSLPRAVGGRLRATASAARAIIDANHGLFFLASFVLLPFAANPPAEPSPLTADYNFSVSNL
jgi:hypothetical protein